MTISFNRQSRLNSLSEQMARDILELTEELRGDAGTDVRALVITSKGRAFSTGRDLKESATHTADDARRYMQLAIASAHAFSTLPMPSIAAINGPCFGWGLEAALACDIRYTSQEATLCFPETKLGIFPGAGGTPRLAKLLPLNIAKELIFSARVLSGAEAYGLGLVNRSVSASELLGTAAELAATIAANGPLGVRAAKRVLQATADMTLPQGLDYSQLERFPLNETEDFKEGLLAFAEKRAPDFKGA